MKTLCVSGLNTATSYESLLDLFSQFGPVDHLCLSSPGPDSTATQFAQVRMQHADANQALRLLNGSILHGHAISVEVVDCASVPA